MFDFILPEGNSSCAEDYTNNDQQITMNTSGSSIDVNISIDINFVNVELSTSAVCTTDYEYVNSLPLITLLCYVMNSYCSL